MSKWRCCCNNIDCMRKHDYKEYEFEPPTQCPICHIPWDECEHAPWDHEVELKCPSCGSSQYIAPAWIKKYRLPGELETIQRLRELDAEIARLQQKARREAPKKIKIPRKLRLLKLLSRFLPKRLLIRYYLKWAIPWALSESFRIVKEKYGEEALKDMLDALPTRVVFKDQILEFPAGTSREEIYEVISKLRKRVEGGGDKL